MRRNRGIFLGNMSADSFLVFAGIRLEIDISDEDAVASVESETDTRMVNARQAGLSYYTALNGEEFLLFIGEKIGLLGGEHIDHQTIDPQSLKEVFEGLTKKLQDAGFTERPELHFQFLADM